MRLNPFLFRKSSHDKVKKHIKLKKLYKNISQYIVYTTNSFKYIKIKLRLKTMY